MPGDIGCAWHSSNYCGRECAICFEDISLGQCVKLLCDGLHPHQFHKACLMKWLMCDKDTCPNCRTTIHKDVIKRLDPRHYIRQMELLVPRPSDMTDQEYLRRIVAAVHQD